MHTRSQKYAMRGSKTEDENTLNLVRAFFNGDDSAAIHNRRNEEPVDNYVNRTWEARSRSMTGFLCFSCLPASRERIVSQLYSECHSKPAGTDPDGEGTRSDHHWRDVLAAAQLRRGAQGGGIAASAACGPGARGGGPRSGGVHG